MPEKNMRNPFSDGDLETNCVEELAKILAIECDLVAPIDMDSTSVWPFRNFIVSLPIAEKVLC